MKKLFPLLLIVVLSNCSKKESPNMKGAYLMVSQVMNDGSKDTVINRRQMKIFTDEHVIYAAMRFPDSLASYAVGTYRTGDGHVMEHYYYSSANQFTEDSFLLEIEKTDTGYKQVIEDLPSQGKTVKLTEVYRNVGNADSTPLNGAWKQTESFNINKKGDTTSNENIVQQLKVYQAGHFIWTSTYLSPAKKTQIFFGYGTFQMDGNNKSKEINTLSTYPPIIDSTFNIELEFMGKDSYKQTIVYPTRNYKSVEIYERLKGR
ncbi:MAG TPA: hypothetical protein VF700_05115 [Segetibacter sp.]